MNHSAGNLLGERYRLLDLLARGGMGEVWRAVDERLGREVAVKVLHAAYAGDASFHERFRAEARNTAAISHPGVAQVYDFGETDGAPWIVMELVPGEPLSALLERGALGVPRTLDVLAQTARALQAAHDGGVVHRDVKPGNLLVTPDGVVKVTDFGIARAADALPLTATGTVMGSAPYLSPEQAHGRSATAASDVYALGIVAYECLVGHRPFVGDTAVDVAAAHASEPPPPLPSSVPQPLKDLVFAMLAKNPADRPDDRQVAERTEALRGATGALAASGATVVVPEGGWREPVPTRTQVIPPLPANPPGDGRPTAAGAGTGGLRPFTPAPRRRGRVALVTLAALIVVGAGAVGLGSILTGGGTSGNSGTTSAAGGASASSTSSTRPSPTSAPRSTSSKSSSPSSSSSASPSASSSGSPASSSASASPGTSLDPKSLVGQQDRDAFNALKAAGYHYSRLRRALDGSHDACSVAEVQQTAAKSVTVTVWWPDNGASACAPLGGGSSRASTSSAAGNGAGRGAGSGRSTGSRGPAQAAVVALEGT